MRIYFNSRGRARGYSMGVGEAYVFTWIQLLFYALAVCVVGMVVIGLLALAVALVLAVFLGLGLWWMVGATIRGRIGARMRAQSSSALSAIRGRSHQRPAKIRRASAAPVPDVAPPRRTAARPTATPPVSLPRPARGREPVQAATPPTRPRVVDAPSRAGDESALEELRRGVERLGEMINETLTLDSEELESAITEFVQGRSGRPVRRVSCPRVAPRLGGTFTCRIEMADGAAGVVQVVQTNDQGGIQIAVPNELLAPVTTEGPPDWPRSGSAGDAKRAAISALARGLQTARPEVELDSDGRVRELRENLVSGVAGTKLAYIIGQIRSGDGGELNLGSRGRQPKLYAPHSSCALAINSFGGWLGEERFLSLGDYVGFESLSFEKKLPTGLQGKPPNLDVVAQRGSAIVAVESKCTEYLSKPAASFSASYDRLIPTMDPSWASVLAELRDSPDRYRFLDAAQLVKHYLGIRHTFPSTPATLLYLYWEPSNPERYAVFGRHRSEITSFASGLGDPLVAFRAMSYRELWTDWSERATSDRIKRHVEELRGRYDVPI